MTPDPSYVGKTITSTKTHILKRCKAKPGFHDEVVLESGSDTSKAYVLTKNDDTGEMRCPCTSFAFVSRDGKECKHIIFYRGVLAKEATADPMVTTAGVMLDAIIDAMGVSIGQFQRQKAVGVLTDRLKALKPFVPPSGTKSGFVDPADVFPGTSLRRIRF